MFLIVLRLRPCLIIKRLFLTYSLVINTQININSSSIGISRLSSSKVTCLYHFRVSEKPTACRRIGHLKVLVLYHIRLRYVLRVQRLRIIAAIARLYRELVSVDIRVLIAYVIVVEQEVIVVLFSSRPCGHLVDIEPRNN